jgi:ADP-heptose:LPS heptosyltransferase
MKIAILNLGSEDELNYTLQCLSTIHNEIISAQIDMFVDKKQAIKLKDNHLINQVIPLDMDDLNIFNLKNKLNNLQYYTKNQYNIAVDTQGTLKSAFLTYNLAGKTAGFKHSSFKGLLISRFYDEQIKIISFVEKKYKTKELFAHTFGY